MASDPSKTEQATPKRIEDARKKGNVAKSQEVGKAISILAGLAALSFWMVQVGREMMSIFRRYLTVTPNIELTDTRLTAMGLDLAASMGKMLLPVMLLMVVVQIVVLRWQVGKLWTTEVFQFKWERFNPVNGLKRMFASLQTFVRLGKSILQAICIGIAPILVVKGEFENFPGLYHMDAGGITVYILTMGAKVTTYALIPMIVIAAADLIYQRWEYAENLKMSKDELKDERKQMEGDMFIKGKMRQKMMAMSSKRMLQDVPKADVVITNPTHIALALRYNAEEAPAPVVLAKGADKVAERIKEIAREHKVPIRENKPLARALYKQTEIGDMIPAELFQAVAIILAQIWKSKNRGGASQ
jgi:flagellar biosynthetic protein FlhB